MAPIFSTSGGYESVNGGAVIREGPVYGGYGGYGGTVIREGPVEGAVVYTGSGATFSSRALEEGGGYGTKVRYVSDGDGGCCSMRNLMMYSTMLAIAIILTLVLMLHFGVFASAATTQVAAPASTTPMVFHNEITRTSMMQETGTSMVPVHLTSLEPHAEVRTVTVMEMVPVDTVSLEPRDLTSLEPHAEVRTVTVVEMVPVDTVSLEPREFTHDIPVQIAETVEQHIIGTSVRQILPVASSEFEYYSTTHEWTNLNVHGSAENNFETSDWQQGGGSAENNFEASDLTFAG